MRVQLFDTKLQLKMVRRNGNFLIPSEFESNDAIEWINAQVPTEPASRVN